MKANIENLILEAGALVRDLLQTDLQIKNKASKDWVTNIDTTVEKFLVAGIKALDPKANFLTEEHTVDFEGLNNLWIIDPIDGTTNLIHLKKNFAISVAYYNKKEPCFGFVYDVMADTMYYGAPNESATVNGVPFTKDTSKDTLDNNLLFGDIHRPNLFTTNADRLRERIATHRFIGSAALEICEVAQGHGAAYVFPKINIWDAAAALIILKCAGGSWYFDQKIEGLPFKTESSLILACANEAIRDTLISHL